MLHTSLNQQDPIITKNQHTYHTNTKRRSNHSISSITLSCDQPRPDKRISQLTPLFNNPIPISLHTLLSLATAPLFFVSEAVAVEVPLELNRIKHNSALQLHFVFLGKESSGYQSVKAHAT